MLRAGQRKFSRSPICKWGLFVLLLACSAAIFWWPQRSARPQPPAKAELLPFTDSPPEWDGSYPYLRIFLPSVSRSLGFASAIAMLPPTIRHDSQVNEIDVDLHTGRLILRQTDLFVPDVMPLSLTRTYIAWDYHSRAFGVGTNHPYDICPTGTRRPYTYMDLNLEDFYQVHMPRISKGRDYADAVFRHSETSSEFYGAQVAWNGNGWTMTFRDGRKIYFPEAYNAKTYAQGAATEMVDAEGHRIQLRRSPGRNLEELISPGGHKIKFRYDSHDRIVEAEDDVGNIREYSYATNGHVEAVSDGSRAIYRFEYAPLMNDKGYDPQLLTRVLDGDGKVLAQMKYQWGRIIEQKLSDGEAFRYDYQLSGADVLQCTVTLPSGMKRVFSFRNGRLINQQ
jgi:YD repeat-containing protein